MSEESRLRIIALLMKREMCVCKLALRWRNQSFETTLSFGNTLRKKSIKALIKVGLIADNVMYKKKAIVLKRISLNQGELKCQMRYPVKILETTSPYLLSKKVIHIKKVAKIHLFLKVRLQAFPMSCLKNISSSRTE